jgi:methylase of polypeptide subunit release factors
MHWTRPALTTKVESLKEKHSGDDFVQAVVEFADQLDSEDRKTLQAVLLERKPGGYPFQLPPRRGRRR